MTLQTRLHKLHRTLELSALIPSLSSLEPTPWARLTLGDHASLDGTIGFAYLTRRKKNIMLLRMKELNWTKECYYLQCFKGLNIQTGQNGNKVVSIKLKSK